MKKELKFGTVMMFVVSIVIGSGVFYKPHALYVATGGSPGIGILAWVIGGILSWLGALTAAEIAAAVPKTGGMIEWIRVAFGDVAAYLLGWAQTVVVGPAFVAALGIIFSKTTIALLGISEGWMMPITIAAVALLLIVDSISVKIGSNINAVTGVIKIIPIAIIAVIGFIKGQSIGGGVVNLTPFFNADGNVGFVSALSGGVLATLFAYQGWIDTGTMAGEMKNPGRDLPRALSLGLLIIAAVYITINVAYLFVFPAEYYIGTDTPALDVAYALFGGAGGTFLNVGILISVFGALNSNTMAYVRSPYALALNDELPFSGLLKKLHPVYRTPVYAAVYMLIMVTVFALSKNYDFLTDLCVVTMWVFYVMVFIAVIKMRKTHPDLERPYKVPLYPVVPIVSIIGGVLVVVLSLMNDFRTNVIGIAVTLCGLPVYYLVKKYYRKKF